MVSDYDDKVFDARTRHPLCLSWRQTHRALVILPPVTMAVRVGAGNSVVEEEKEEAVVDRV